MKLFRLLKNVKNRITPLVLNKTAAYTITADDASYGGVIVTNSGASGAVVLTPPTAAPGLRITLVVAAAQALTFDLATGQSIRGLATSGQTFTADAEGETLQLLCAIPNVWESVGAADGTWTAA